MSLVNRPRQGFLFYPDPGLRGASASLPPYFAPRDTVNETTARTPIINNRENKEIRAYLNQKAIRNNKPYFLCRLEKDEVKELVDPYGCAFENKIMVVTPDGVFMKDKNDSIF